MSESQRDREQLARENEALRRQIAALQIEATRFKTTLQSIGDAVISVDDDGNIIQMNPVASSLTGWSEVEAKGRPIAEVFKIVNEETRSEVESPIARVLREGFVVGLENHTLLIAKDGTERPIADSGAPIRNEKGETTGVVLVFRDQTEERRHEAALRESAGANLLQAELLRNAPVIAAFHDRNHNIVWANRAYEEATGLSQDEIAGRKCYAVWCLAEPCRGCPVATAIDSGVASCEAELTPQNQDHWPESQGYWLSRAAPVRDENGKVIGAIEMAFDIGDRKRAETALRASEERVRKRTVQLEESNKELEAFAYSVSHDLRAPLRAIEGFSQALMEDYPDRLDTQGKDYLSRVSAEAQRMAQLIDDLLMLSRVTRAEMRKEQVNLTSVAQDVLAGLGQGEPERQLAASVADGLMVQGDSRLLRQVIENLLGNAWKFTGTRQKATLELGAVEQDGRVVYFVRDNGVGFDMKYSNMLFAPFQRLHGMEEFPGTGIGLSTVQRIVKRHGGRVWFESEPDKGTTCYFTLHDKGEVEDE